MPPRPQVEECFHGALRPLTEGVLTPRNDFGRSKADIRMKGLGLASLAFRANRLGTLDRFLSSLAQLHLFMRLGRHADHCGHDLGRDVRRRLIGGF